VPYQHDEPAALLTQTPFVGRTAELARLGQRLRDARGGHGAVVLLAGEAGIGKTRTLEELAESARTEGAMVLWGRCYEGEAARPYGAFAEALTEYVRMQHCAGGPGPHSFDVRSAIDQWVETGIAPDRIIAAHTTACNAGRTRPLCPYPQVARYKGSGSIEHAASFNCVDR
jgi:hypothetical protein